MKSKIISLEDSIKIIKNSSVVAVGGFIGSGHAEAITAEIEKSFLKYGTPNDLTLIYAAGQGDSKDKGLNHFGHKGLVSKIIGGHWALCPKLQKLAIDNEAQAYNIPQGIISHMYRDIAAGKPGTISKVGLQTFVDQRLGGGKLNESTTEDIVKVINIDDKEYL
ncbi:CoA-transferase, partial [Clostridium perfringens]